MFVGVGFFYNTHPPPPKKKKKKKNNNNNNKISYSHHKIIENKQLAQETRKLTRAKARRITF
jgi:hypothetical protein